MAQTMLVNSKLRLLFDAGMGERGEQLYKAKTFSNIRKDATADELHQAAQAISALCKEPMVKIERTDSNEIA